jgi:hypothetical protein
MEQPCYKCGQTVDEGVAFCPHCSAPQIRVVMAEPAPRPLAFAGAAAAQDSEALPASQTVPVLAVPMRWSQAFRPCALVAIIAAVAMVTKLVAWPIAVSGAGFLAVAFYRRASPGVGVSAGTGARLGALTGVFCSAMTAVLLALRVAIFHEGEEIRRLMLEGIQQSASRYSDPQFAATLEFMRSPAGLTLMMAFALILGIVTFVLAGTIGGALGAAILGRRGQS